MSEKKPVIILDRDGVVIVDKHYMHDPNEVEFPEGAIEGMKMLSNSGYALILITGQSGIGRGKYPESDMHRVHARIFEELDKHNITFETLAWCPHDPKSSDFECACRKPGTRLLDEAEYRLKGRFEIDWEQSWGIGDKPADSRMMFVKGGKAALVRSEYWDESTKLDEKGKDVTDVLGNQSNIVVDSLLEAADKILK